MTPKMRTRGAWPVVLAMVLAVGAAGCGGGEARKAKHVEQGQKFMAERNYTKARLEFRNALQIDPKDAEARAWAGLAAEKLGNFEEAVKLYRVAIAADENLELPRVQLGRMMVLAGMADEAMELVEPGLERNPQSARLLSVRGMIRAQKGEVASARKDAERAVELEPTDEGVVMVLALMMWREGEREQAAELLTRSLVQRPDQIEMRLVLAEMLVELQKPEAAEAEFREVIKLEPDKVDRRFRLAQIQLMQGKEDPALATAREAVAASPGDVRAKMALAGLVSSLKSYEEADKELAAYLRNAPEDFALHINAGEFYESQGQDARAEEIYRGVIERAGDKGPGVTAKGRLAALKLRTGRTDEAARLAGEVLRDHPTNSDVLVVRADIALARGDAIAAVADLRAAFGNQPDSVPLAVALSRAYVASGQEPLAEQVLRSVVQTNPRDVHARFALARFLVDAGRQAQARPVLEQLVSEQPGNLLALEGLARLQTASRDLTGAMKSAAAIQALQPKSATGYVIEGQAQEALSGIDAARRAYERAAEVDPAAEEPVVALARLDVAAGRREQALARLDERLTRTPGNAILLAVRGDVLVGLKRPMEAVTSYAEAIKAMPGVAQLYRGQAAAYLAAGRPEEAMASLKVGLERTDGAPAIAWDLARLQVEAGRVDDAVATYESLLSRNPGDDASANNLAMLLVTHKSDARSLDRAAQLVERFKDSTAPAFIDTYGWVLYKRGRFADAASALGKAVERRPDAREYRYHLAMAQLKLGQEDDARGNLQRAVAEGPEYEGLEEARRILASM